MFQTYVTNGESYVRGPLVADGPIPLPSTVRDILGVEVDLTVGEWHTILVAVDDWGNPLLPLGSELPSIEDAVARLRDDDS